LEEINMSKKTIINLDEIKSLYKNYCKENKMKFSETRFEKFLKFLETDFYDWVYENLKQFDK